MSYLVAIDGEFTGPRLTENSLVSLGLAFLNLDTGEIENELEIIIKMREGTKWNTTTLENFWNTKEHLIELKDLINKGGGLEINDAMERFEKFLRVCKMKSTKNFFFAHDKAAIDCSWINFYLSLVGKDPLHLLLGEYIPIIDTDSFDLGSCRLQHSVISEMESQRMNRKHSQSFSCSEFAFSYLGIRERAKTRKTHRAVDDAKNIAETHYLLTRSFRQEDQQHQHQQNSIYYIIQNVEKNIYYQKQQIKSN